MDESKGFFHFRQLDDQLFDKNSFRTIELPGVLGIKAVVGHLHLHLRNHFRK